MGLFSKSDSNKPEVIFKKIMETKYPDFKIVKEFWGCDHLSVIAVDETNTKVATGVKLSLRDGGII